MEPKRVEPLVGARDFLKAHASGAFEKVKYFFNKKIGDITVDTVCAPDSGLWETGIERLGIEGKWIIVEQYPNRDEAEKGHSKWVELMTSQPDAPLKDIDLWSLGL